MYRTAEVQKSLHLVLNKFMLNTFLTVLFFFSQVKSAFVELRGAQVLNFQFSKQAYCWDGPMDISLNVKNQYVGHVCIINYPLAVNCNHKKYDTCNFRGDEFFTITISKVI